MIPIVIVALGAMPRCLEELEVLHMSNLRTMGIKIKVELIKKVALLGTAQILRKVLEHG